MQFTLRALTQRKVIMANEETFRGKWTEIKGEIKNQWGKLTEDELEKTFGNLVSIAGLIQQRYGAKKEEVQEKLNSIAARFSEKTERIKNELKEKSNHQ